MMRPIDEGRRACLISCAVAGLVRLADAADGCIDSEWHTPHAATGMAHRVARTAHVPMHEADRRREAAGATPAVPTRESANAVASGRRMGLMVLQPPAVRV
jgi:hypothetical protein